MAQGAIRATKQLGRHPGKETLIGGIDWADFAFEHVRQGNMTTTIGGHFLDGARSLIMIYDHHNGYDFKLESQSHFSAITKDNIAQYDRHFKSSDGWEKINFKEFTKTHSPEYHDYDFSLEAMFKVLDK